MQPHSTLQTNITHLRTKITQPSLTPIMHGTTCARRELAMLHLRRNHRHRRLTLSNDRFSKDLPIDNHNMTLIAVFAIIRPNALRMHPVYACHLPTPLTTPLHRMVMMQHLGLSVLVPDVSRLDTSLVNVQHLQIKSGRSVISAATLDICNLNVQ